MHCQPAGCTTLLNTLSASKYGTRKNVSSVVQDNLCVGCGSCVAGCPAGVLEMRVNCAGTRYIPEIVGRCNNCGRCLSVCPGSNIDFDNGAFEEMEGSKYDDRLGNYQELLFSYSCDEKLRFACASGGTVTALLLWLLKTGRIDAALVTTMRTDGSLEPQCVVAETSEQLIEARGPFIVQ